MSPERFPLKSDRNATERMDIHSVPPPQKVLDTKIVEETKEETRYFTIGNISIELTPITTVVLAVVILGLGFIALKSMEIFAFIVVFLVLVNLLGGTIGNNPTRRCGSSSLREANREDKE